jgi:hydrogenase maturation protease
VEAIANAVLYEGYLLYPYRQSAVKNQVRWTFGGVHPQAWSEATGGFEPWVQQTQCLVANAGFPGDAAGDGAFPAGCRISATVRFLRLMGCRRDEQSWQEAAECSLPPVELDLEHLFEVPVRQEIKLAAGESREDEVRREWQALSGQLEAWAERAAAAVARLTLRVLNTTALPEPGRLSREEAVLHSMASTHVVLRVSGGRFISLADPAPALLEAAQACKNVGAWPVLVGEPGSDDTLLASPIILEDHPQVAPESAMDLFDSTEIDELLTLRILTLSDREKAEVRTGDERGRRLLERAEALTSQELMRMHGTLRNLRRVGEQDWPEPTQVSALDGGLRL